jgi:hypothetical protein
MQRHNTENEHQRQHEHNHGINLQTGRFIRVESYSPLAFSSLLFNPLSSPPPFPNPSFSPRYPHSHTNKRRKKKLTQHRTTTPSRTRRPRATRPRIRHLILLVRRRPASNRRLGSARGSWGAGPAGRGASSRRVDRGGGAW